eukprot:CAMPEP_0171133230 /NCGR_PEP_ID=MMETSP0766_2-20121228/125919_1 /TAXON_ID=439317 /ORGANISM="Gambierdiscus australes, Strain CAWD 149" /LENGTH=243 /DNA_ID=CAMNT_0011596599 /DNA_START=40 /DNA_END=767 /DNA_ORIENTATION=-
MNSNSSSMAQRLNGPVVLYFGGASVVNRGLSSGEGALLVELHRHGISMVVAGLCGFGDDLWRGGLWEFAPLLLGRTHVGLHAEEVLRVVWWTVGALGARKIVLVAAEDAAPAVLHAAVHILPSIAAHAAQHQDLADDKVLVGLSLVRSLCCFADVAVSWRHVMPWQMQMHGVLQHYDLPDLLAALVDRGGPSTLVIEPRDAEQKPLSWHRACIVYDLAMRCFVDRGKRLRILTGRRSEERASR